MNHILQLLLIFSFIIVVAKLAGALANRFGQPAVLGEITAGLILGPTLLNFLEWPVFATHGLTADAVTAFNAFGIKPYTFYNIIEDLAEIGVILLMFVAGMETDLKEMKKVGKTAFWAAFGGVVCPLLAALFIAHIFNHGWSQSLFIGAILTATSVSISAQTLMELNQLRSKEGSTILGAAVIDDVMGIIVLSLVVAFTFSDGKSGGMAAVPGTIIKMVAFFVIAWWAGRKFLEKITEKIVKIPASQALMSFVLVFAFLYAVLAEYFGQVAAITGSYMAGVLFAQTKFKEQIDKGIHPITYSLFVPIFFISIGLRADATRLGNDLVFLVVVLVLAILCKIIGCGVGARLTGFNNQESLRVGVGMISRGEVGLIVAGYGLSHGIIDENIFSIMVIMVLATTLVTPLLLRFVFPRVTQEVEADVYESVAHIEDNDDQEKEVKP
jgi:Kef-type K+ transport system membrane component KefB